MKWHELTEELDEKGNPITKQGSGTITGIKLVNKRIEFTLADGKKITPGNISEVLSGSSSSNSLVDASQLIGKTVSYIPDTTDTDKTKTDASEEETESETPTEMTATVESVSKKDGIIVYNLSDGTAITADQITSIR